jgi:peptidoglycan/xylan/chitin deacetylase (PgdA/CDA1 family)
MTFLKELISFLIYAIGQPFRTPKPVVLVYHAVDALPAAADPLKLAVAPELFACQMEELARRRLDCTVSFDDGHESVLTRAWPVLEKHRLRSILFIATDYIDGGIKFDGHFAPSHRPTPLRWEQIRQLAAAGMEMGSHSKTHRRMTSLEETQMLEEALGSRERIRRMTGRNVEAFSYPFGDIQSFDEKTEAALRQAGYRKAYTNIMGPDNSVSEPLRIRRIRVYRTDTLFRFRMKIAGAYNWTDRLLAKVPGAVRWPDPGRRISE